MTPFRLEYTLDFSAQPSELERGRIRTQLADDRCVPVFLDETTQDEYYNGPASLRS